MTTDAMILSDFGEPVNPGQLDAWYTQNGVYAPDPAGGRDLLDMQAPDHYASAHGGNIALTSSLDYSLKPCPQSALVHDISKERVKVRIHAPAVGFDTHFLKVDDASSWSCADPWTGTSHSLTDYGDPAAIITGVYKYANAAAPSVAAPPSQPRYRSVLMAGQSLGRGGVLISPSGRYFLALQTDGNLVLYDGGRSIWSSGTFGRPSNVLVMQTDGNLVIYDSVPRPLWASQTSGKPQCILAVQDDGNVVIYSASQPVWATNTYGK